MSNSLSEAENVNPNSSKKHDYLFLPLIKLLPMSITPNHLSMLRLILAFPIIVLTCLHFYKLTGALFLVAAILDGLDGSMARLRKQETKIGTILDPTADKVVNFSVFIGLLFHVKTSTYLSLILVIIIIDTCLFGIALFKFFVKDIFPKIDKKHHDEMGFPEMMQQITISKTGANRWGKIKMVAQVIVISALLLFDPQTSLWVHTKIAYLPDIITLLHFSFPLLIACIILGLLSLYGHLSVIKFT